LQIDWNQDQGPNKWALILAPVYLPQALHLKNIAKIKVIAEGFLQRTFCIPDCNGVRNGGSYADDFIMNPHLHMPKTSYTTNCGCSFCKIIKLAFLRRFFEDLWISSFK